MNLVVDSTIPVGAGLSSSAAFTCSIIMAAADLADTRLAPEAIALIAQKAETEGVGVPVGVMDPIAAMCCVEGHALLLDCRSLTIENIPFEAATPAAHTAVIVVDTRAHRSLAGGEYAADGTPAGLRPPLSASRRSGTCQLRCSRSGVLISIRSSFVVPDTW